MCSGIFGILGTVATLASLHRCDSLESMLIRRWTLLLNSSTITVHTSEPCLNLTFYQNIGVTESLQETRVRIHLSVSVSIYPSNEGLLCHPSYEQNDLTSCSTTLLSGPSVASRSVIEAPTPEAQQKHALLPHPKQISTEGESSYGDT
jgi:hypothetical protein